MAELFQQNYGMNIPEVLKLIDLLLSIGIKTTLPALGWNIPTCWRLCFVFIAVSLMPQLVDLYEHRLGTSSQKHK